MTRLLRVPASNLAQKHHPPPRDAHDGGGGTGNDDIDMEAPLLSLAMIAAASSPLASTTNSLSSLLSEEDSGGSDTPPPARPRPKRVAAATGASAPPDGVAEWAEDDCPTSSTEDSHTSVEQSQTSDDEQVVGQGRGRHRGGRGSWRGGRGRGGVRRRDPGHAETATTVQRHNVLWTKNAGRTIDPARTGGGYSQPPRLTLYNYTDKDERRFFEHLLPDTLVHDIATATTVTGSNKVRPGWSVNEGEVYLFLGLKMYMMIYPQQGPREDYWEASAGNPGSIYVDHNLGRFGMPSGRYREIERSFTLPHRGNMADPFDPIRAFVESWNQNMAHAFIPGWVMTVDESMAKWKGKGMPALMSVPRKPTPVGREAHTTACGQTGVIVAYEVYEGKQRMETAEYVQEAGKNPAKALRCTKPWHGSGRVVILDSGFASVKCAKALRDKGLFMIGNVKTASMGFPKDWLISQVPRRGMRAVCTTTVTTDGGIQLELLGAADRDRQPMALLGTAGTSIDGGTLHRHFTTIRADGSYNVRDATLEQMNIHEIYRKYFNALDRHNSVRQGGHCFEDSWKTQNWFVRDFQMIWGITEVNAWLLYKRFKPGYAYLSFNNFRRALAGQLLTHPKWLGEQAQQRLLRIRPTTLVVQGDPHPLVSIGYNEVTGFRLQKACAYCGKFTTWQCMCKVDETSGFGIPICNATCKRDCSSRHRAGQAPPNRKSEAQKRRWAAIREGGRRRT